MTLSHFVALSWGEGHYHFPIQEEEELLLLSSTDSQLFTCFIVLVFEESGQLKFWVIVVACLEVDSKYILENFHPLRHFYKSFEIDSRLFILDVFLHAMQFHHVSRFIVCQIHKQRLADNRAGQ